MAKLLKILLVGLITSFFIFPFNIPFLSDVNTKMILAVFGLIGFFFDRAGKKGFFVSKDFLWMSLIAIMISLWSFCAVLYNHTSDYLYVSYIMSFWVWMGGAYAVVGCIKYVHGEATTERIGNYIIGVCVFQCILAYAMTLSPPLMNFINSLMGESAAFMGRSDTRMYGLGAALDPAGLRFAAALTIISYLSLNAAKKDRFGAFSLYVLSFLVILIFGDMISRSTIIGLVLGIAVVLWRSIFRKDFADINIKYLLISILFIGVIIFVCVVAYQTDAGFRANLRFGFEGFFSLAEKGRWEVRSNETLKNMIVWPETLKTWIIGDGYAFNPSGDPNFLGVVTGGFYMGTDIGYLRFIFYFGFPGMVMMVALFIYIAAICFLSLDDDKLLFLFLLLSNMIGWIKVSSDIIMILAPFLVLALVKKENELSIERKSRLY